MDKTLIKKEFKALGTEINVWLVAYEEEKEKVLESARKLENFYKQKEKIFSRFDLKSELSLLNKNLGKFQKASEDIFSLSERSLVYNEFSQGFFDPRIFDILEKIGYEKDFYSSDFKNKEIKYNQY